MNCENGGGALKKRGFADRIVYWIRLRGVWLALPLLLVLAHPTVRLLVVGGGVSLLGLAIRAWAGGTLRKDLVLTTTGPYAYSRNPLYIGTLFIGLGLCVAGALPYFALAIVLFFGLFYGHTMRREARELEQRFGDVYRDYAAHVPLLRPRLMPYRPTVPQSEPFRWSRYRINKEWEAALGVVFLYALLVAKLLWLP
jgi:protein-S-isoprenylcysteine O-methyltransferase Ste14